MRPVAKLRSKVKRLEQARPSGESVEIEIGRELLRLLVEDVERPVEIVDEEAPAARLVAQEIDPGQFARACSRHSGRR